MSRKKPAGTLGGSRLRALRELCGKTQLEVELDAHLGIGYLQRIESGKVWHPERDTLERILDVLALSYTDRRSILEAFGYTVPTLLPDADEIRAAVDIYQSELTNAVFPAYLLDCTHRMLAWNPFATRLYALGQRGGVPVNKGYVSVLRILFDPAFGVTTRITNADTFFPAQIRALRYEMQWFRDEPWYAPLIADMRRFPLFADYWQRSENEPRYQLSARPLVPFELVSIEGVPLQFRVISEPFAQDRRFRVIYLLPANAETIQECVTWGEISS